MIHRLHRLGLVAAASLMCAFSAHATVANWYEEQLLDPQPATPTSVSPEGIVLGQSLSWPCGATSVCSPQAQWSVWRGQVRHALPVTDGFTAQPHRIGPKGVVVGAVVDAAGVSHAARWRYDGSAYQLQRLNEGLQGVGSQAVSVDAQGRAIGWRRLASGEQRPTLWGAAGGARDLIRLGFPASLPVDMSPAGWVVTPTHRYQIDDVAVTKALPALPSAKFSVVPEQWRVDDAGRVLVLVTTGSSLLTLRTGEESALTWDWTYLQAPQASATAGGSLGGISADGTPVFTLAGGAHIGMPFPNLPLVFSLVYRRGMAPQGDVTMPFAAGIDTANRPVVSAQGGGINRAVRLLPQSGAAIPATPYVRASAYVVGASKLVDAVPGGGSCGAGKAREVKVLLAATDSDNLPVVGAQVRGAVMTRASGQWIKGVTDANGLLWATVRDLECDSPVQAWMQSVTPVDGRTVTYALTGRRATQAALLP